MARFHVHLHVTDLEQSIAFYSRLFGAQPARHETDYAKWMLEDPKLNFAISTRGEAGHVDHLGFQAETEAELATLRQRAADSEGAVADEGATSCCYAQSVKHWVTDPQGVAWEQFQTLANIPVFGKPAAQAPAAEASACCPPRGKPVGIPVKSGCC